MEFVDMIRPDSGCTLANSEGFVMFQGIFRLSAGNPCDGCPHHSGCAFLREQLNTAHSRRVSNFGLHSHETNAEIAKRMNISKRQVAKMRKKGEL
ncbi:hypothetical protein LCGC14_1194550 [marine sediment metagenome]|uniref:Uncharacterized protein n=1 Tax=marine sediment metagenome TaxID=412755 RepID=A0A0F9LIS7_9ZZZZ